MAWPELNPSTALESPRLATKMRSPEMKVTRAQVPQRMLFCCIICEVSTKEAVKA